MKSYLEVSVSSTEAQRELLIPTMIEIGCKGFQETDADLLCYFELTDERNREELRTALKSLVTKLSANADVRFREFAEENWNEKWEQSLQPIEIGSRIVVKPSWCQYDNVAKRLMIEIDPKMSFGTGYHETTRLVLGLLEKTITNGMKVLDVGTGTGILAIAAVKLGAATATGTDIDEWSIENGLENVQRNNVDNKVQILDIPLEKLSSASFDIICANLTLNTNLEFLNDFARLLAPGGQVFLSGLLLSDEHLMNEGLTKSRFVIHERVVENEWIALSAGLASGVAGGLKS
ncbi:MAG TPA: 50S ribosomal protein L11 methyltransferase [Bacteroidota bacterium]|jgi:ribosomal protein L11 methyltransferase|nr:50S ribosomal protein L11 methyltransferase [Bacteroidota bacterium]